jgi:hypothetical protein
MLPLRHPNFVRKREQSVSYGSRHWHLRILRPIQQLTFDFLNLTGMALGLRIGVGHRRQERRPIMQLKLPIDGTVPSTTEYSIVVTCNKCAGLHEMGISVTMGNGPAEKQSIGDLYDRKSLPKSLADLTNTSISCPKTGRQSTQKNLYQIFLVPTTNHFPKRHSKSGAATSIKF